MGHESDLTGANSTLLAGTDEGLSPDESTGHSIHVVILVLASNDLGTAKQRHRPLTNRFLNTLLPS
jgi:hypothetical protein